MIAALAVTWMPRMCTTRQNAAHLLWHGAGDILQGWSDSCAPARVAWPGCMHTCCRCCESCRCHVQWWLAIASIPSDTLFGQWEGSRMCKWSRALGGACSRTAWEWRFYRRSPRRACACNSSWTGEAACSCSLMRRSSRRSSSRPRKPVTTGAAVPVSYLQWAVSFRKAATAPLNSLLAFVIRSGQGQAAVARAAAHADVGGTAQRRSAGKRARRQGARVPVPAALCGRSNPGAAG